MKMQGQEVEGYGNVSMEGHQVISTSHAMAAGKIYAIQRIQTPGISYISKPQVNLEVHSNKLMWWANFMYARAFDVAGMVGKCLISNKYEA